MKQLDPKSVWIFFVSFVARWFFLLVFFTWIPLSMMLGTAGNQGRIIHLNFNYLYWVLLFIPLFMVFCFIWAKLSYKYYKYELTENGFKKESGVIYKKYVTIPYDRIQNIDINRGIISRMLGLSDLQIQTAGFSAVMGNNMARGIGAEGRLPALSKDTAEQLREELLIKIKQSKNQGL